MVRILTMFWGLAVLDKLRLFVPFRPEHVAGGNRFCSIDDALASGFTGLVDLSGLNIPLEASMTRDVDGKLTVGSLRHCWEKLPSSFTPMAFKVHNNASHYPGIELKASPAKILQGHNVFGPLDIGQGGAEMLTYVSMIYPELYDMLEVGATQVYEFDVTFSTRVPSETVARQVVQALHSVSNGQTKNRGDTFETTAYFGSKKSRLKKVKIYLKEAEFENQLAEVKKSAQSGDRAAQRVFEVMSDFRLREWVKGLLRLEATVMKRSLERRKVPTNFFQLAKYQRHLLKEGRCFLSEAWKYATQDIFDAWQGATMKVIDDEHVIEALKSRHVRFTKSGKPSYAYAMNLYRTFKAIRDDGFVPTQKAMSLPTFYRHISDITECGVSKAQLQSMKAIAQKNNVVPLLRFVEVDFSAQRPDWYREPVSQFS
jgi:II/X family phage/plasmid replication protein